MKRKQLLLPSIVLCILLLVTSVFTVFALTKPTVYVDYNDNAVAGQTLSVPVAIKNNTGLMGFRINIDYDSNVLTPISVSYGDAIQGGIQDNIEGDAKEGNFCVYWAGTENVNENGVLFYANFEVSKYAFDSTEIQLSYSQADTFDENFNDVELECESKLINVSNSSVTSFAKLNATAKNIVAGENVVLKIAPETIMNLTSAELNIKYDADSLSYASSTNSMVTDYNGIINLSIPYVSKTVELTFNTTKSTKAGKYNFEITPSEDNVLCDDCEFYISPASTSRVSQIKVDETYYELGEELRIPVAIENNDGIMGYRLTIEYDTEMFANPSVEKNDSFGGTLFDSVGNYDGKFDVFWNSTEQVAKDDVLFYLCFDALKSGTTSINISYDQSDTFNEKYEDVVLICNDAELSICNGHYYHYVGNVKSYEMDYVCDNCGMLKSFSADEVYDKWSAKYVNKAPNKTSSIIDVNYDKIINAKDYAMIISSQRLK